MIFFFFLATLPRGVYFHRDIISSASLSWIIWTQTSLILPEICLNHKVWLSPLTETQEIRLCRNEFFLFFLLVAGNKTKKMTLKLTQSDSSICFLLMCISFFLSMLSILITLLILIFHHYWGASIKQCKGSNAGVSNIQAVCQGVHSNSLDNFEKCDD